MGPTLGRLTRACTATALILIGAACGGPSSPSMTTVTLSAADNGRSLAVARGDRLVISLEENPTTGFRWAVESNSAAVLAPASDELAARGPAIGAGGMRQLTYSAVAAGTSAVRLKHLRSWEGDTSIIARFAVTVTVR